MSESIRATQGIHHAGLTVPDLSAAQRFFTEGLGFETVGEVPDYPAAFVSDGAVMITLWQAEVRPGSQRMLECVAPSRLRRDRQGAGVRRLGEPRTAGQQRGPGAPFLVACGRDEKGQGGVERLVLAGQGGTHHLPGPGLDALVHAEAALDGSLSFVER